MGGVMSAPVKLAQSLGVVSQSKPSSAQQAAPSTAVVSQSSAADAVESVSKRRRGKSPTILTDGLGSGGSLTTESKTLLGG
jgi:hypothetical protein